MATASDNFNRADAATLGANWATAKGMVGPLGILSNGVKDPDGAGNRVGSYYSNVSFSADQFSQATFVARTTGGQMVTVRSITSGVTRNAYGGGHHVADFGDYKYCIFKWVAGTLSQLAVHASETVTAGDVLRLEISGTTLTLYANAVQKVQVTDVSHAAGQPGMHAESVSASTVWFDDWSGGDLSAAAARRLGLLGVG